MEEVKILRHVRAPYKKSMIYTRLGYMKTRTFIEKEQAKQVDRWITEAEMFCDITVIYRFIGVESVSADSVRLSGGITFNSGALAAFLQDSREVALMASAVGIAVDNEINRLQNSGEMAKALVYDAAASVIADAGLDWLMAYLRRMLMQRGKILANNRFSPGFADLDLSNQSIFYDLLELSKLGIQITPKYILIPRKSVTAAAGISAPCNGNQTENGGDLNDKEEI
ncbi:MAG TPA: methionine synthase [Clostridia bacterium]